jgi:hypothetical protein
VHPSGLSTTKSPTFAELLSSGEEDRVLPSVLVGVSGEIGR